MSEGVLRSECGGKERQRESGSERVSELVREWVRGGTSEGGMREEGASK